MEILEQARAAAAAYWRYRVGYQYENDAKCIEEGRSDYATDVQTALITLFMADGLEAKYATIQARAIVDEAHKND